MEELLIIIVTLLILISLFYIIRGEKKNINLQVKKDYKEPKRPLLKPINKAENNNQNNQVFQASKQVVINVVDVKETIQSINFFGYQKNSNFKIRDKFEGYEVNFYTYYYPNRIGNFTNEQLVSRRLIFDFKDGLTPIKSAKLIASCILNSYEKLIIQNKSSIVFCSIPASTKNKHNLRFYAFSKTISEDLQILNGFDFIDIIKDRPAIKGKKMADRVSNLRYNNSAFKGKIVFLFDDVFTFGKSFTENANRIKAAGATLVIGIFLGKTYYDV